MEEIFPINESGPCIINISFNSIILDDEDIGLSMAIGIISLGNIFIFINDIMSFKKLLFTKTVTEIIRANIDGKISIIILNPSFTPFKNSSYMFTFLYIAYIITISVINGRIIFDIYVIFLSLDSIIYLKLILLYMIMLM